MYKIYGKENCPFCQRAKTLLDIKGLEYEYIDLSKDETAIETFKEHGFRTVPIIYKDDVYIGGYTDLHASLSD